VRSPALDRVGIEASRPGKALAEPGDHLLAVDGAQPRRGVGLGDQEPDGVAAEVDRGETRQARASRRAASKRSRASMTCAAATGFSIT